VQEKPLSNLEPKVSWRLNDLLRASQKAREFAAVAWSSPDDKSSKEFTRWQPTRLSSSGSEEFSIVDDVTEEQEKEPDLKMVAQEELNLAKQQAYEEGFTKGRDESESKYSLAKQNLIELTESICENQKNGNEFFVPLKKLALHLAQQLVRGELNISGMAIDRLVKAALDDIDMNGGDSIVINLHPADLDNFKLNMDPAFAHLDVREDPQLSQGSVSVTIGDSAIEDLIENRLQALGDNLVTPLLVNTSLQSIDMGEGLVNSEVDVIQQDSLQESPAQEEIHTDLLLDEDKEDTDITEIDYKGPSDD
jgi:flagellar biosynthesis/type III secretory pathway protein FliH|tara:strand:+ start:11819 stop:12739 length:921 start_codon:yes stop_codon:yes gene_type:complete